MKPRIAVLKFASCDGCQLQFLNAEDELLTLAELVDLAYFPEARSRMEPGPYDVAFVEGSITTPEDAQRVIRVRNEARILVTIGACATAGGIQSLRNWATIDDYLQAVYPTPAFVSTLSTSTPVSEHVKVDVELSGCPIDREQLLAVVRALLFGAMPAIPGHPVCLECKRRGLACVTVTRGEPCLGPVTRTGCGAICPAMHRGCYGCFGPADDPNLEAFGALLTRLGLDRAESVRRLRSFTGYLRPFRDATEAWERSPDEKPASR